MYESCFSSSEKFNIPLNRSHQQKNIYCLPDALNTLHLGLICSYPECKYEWLNAQI